MNVSKREHYSFGDIYEFIKKHTYPDGITDKGKKANFRRACRAFCIVDNKLFYNRRQANGDQLKVKCLCFIISKSMTT